MNGANLLILIAIFVPTNADELASADKLVDALVQRVLSKTLPDHTIIDSTTLGKPDHLTISGSRPTHLMIPSGMNVRPVPSMHAIPIGGSVSPWASHRPFFEMAMQGRHMSARAENKDGFKEGYKFGDLTKGLFSKGKEALTEMGKEVTGDENYQIGDVSKKAAQKAKDTVKEIGKEVTGDENYEIGDITKTVAKAAAVAAAEKAAADTEKLKQAADAAGKVITEDENYEFGDMTKDAIEKTVDLGAKTRKAIAEGIDDTPKA
eukprot:gnl/TRDRNA2_/TRDRNA2_83565_c0_seq1.p1 gnl/TRDRNA2_/TRDRNA2_83565_c0~~gnl/TRDRNA2_/TRDRNA2_83565_c0_seq1.p1  ORF type:complete len:263 (-),score=63.11 gnl/TRDRNA2_/TRDRNA2_83565_c0_seq1:109-897(-)